MDVADSALTVLLLHTLRTKCYDIKLSNPCSKKRRTVLKLESDSEEEAEEDCQRYTIDYVVVQ